MGLLDEAIREHLELKRRRGADPGEVAREQHEALAPVFADEPASWGVDPQGAPAAADEAFDASLPPAVPGAFEEPDEAYTAERAQRAEPAGSGEESFEHVGQETAELDMQSVLDAHDRELEPPADAGAVPHGDSMEWEMPPRVTRRRPAEDGAHDAGEASRDADPGRAFVDAAEVPGQERLSFE